MKNPVILARKGEDMGGPKREQLQIGATVRVVQKQDQGSGKLTEGVVQKFLTKSATHPHGIKVMLEGGVVGRVKEVVAILEGADQ